MDIEALAIALQHPTTLCVGALNKNVYKGSDGGTGCVNIWPVATLVSALPIDPQTISTHYGGLRPGPAQKPQGRWPVECCQ